MTVGAYGALSHAISAFVQEGDEVSIFYYIFARCGVIMSLCLLPR